MTGLNVRLKRPIRFMRPAMGQKRVHHLRKNTSSMISINGMRTTATVMSALANRRQNTSTVAKVRPMGHTQAKHREAEDGRGQKRAAQHIVARIQLGALLLAGAAALAAALPAAAQLELGDIERLIALRLLQLAALLRRTEERAQLAQHGHRADPAAERAAEQEHQQRHDDDAEHGARDQGL